MYELYAGEKENVHKELYYHEGGHHFPRDPDIAHDIESFLLAWVLDEDDPFM